MIPTTDEVLNVFAAASLTQPFTKIAREYEATHRGVKVRLNFAGSQTLAAQIKNGAPADVFASASGDNLVESGADPATFRVFARNRLAVVVRPGVAVDGIANLIRARRIVLADTRVPVGRYASDLLDRATRRFGRTWRATVDAHVVSRELDVKSVVRKVELGEADAGVVYASDVSPRVRAVPIPEVWNLNLDYPVGIVTGPDRKRMAREFVKFLFTPKSQGELASSGFISPLRAPSVIAIGGHDVRLEGHRAEAVRAKGHDGVERAYRGIPLADLLRPRTGLMTVVAADGYRRTFKVADTIPTHAVLVREADGNYQLVIPGRSEDDWVRWVRRIDLQ